MSLSSCFELDNWDAPNCTIRGTVIDTFTNEPLLSSQNDWQLRYWERSWSGHEGGATTYQELRIKQDGTYQNTKLFAGTYDILPYDGPFWTIVDTTKNVQISGTTELNFKVTPYLSISDYTYAHTNMPSPRQSEPALLIKFRVKAPLLEKRVGSELRTIPNLREIRVFISHTDFCGNGSDSNIGHSDYTNSNSYARRDINQTWTNILNSEGADKANNTSPEYSFTIPVKKGYTYSVRVGASTNTGGNRFNYSPIKKIVIPK